MPPKMLKNNAPKNVKNNAPKNVKKKNNAPKM